MCSGTQRAQRVSAEPCHLNQYQLISQPSVLLGRVRSV